MKALYDRYRPATFAEVVGQEKAMRKIDAISAHGGIGGRAFWFAGASGTGKTTLARIMAESIAEKICLDELDASDLTPARLRDIERTMHLYGLGKGGRAYIVNEAHGLRKDAIRQLLVLLERIPDHCAWFFTTTNDGQDSLFEEQIDAHPLLSRCLRIDLARRDLAKPFAEKCREIARKEGLDGKPIEDYVKLAQKCKNNFRAMLQEIEAGAMTE